MRNILVCAVLFLGATGCGHYLRICETGESCPQAAPAQAARCPAPQVSVQAPGEIEVQAPRQKIVVEVPPAAAAPAQPAAQAPYMPAMTPMQGYGQPMMVPATAQVQERTGFGFMFDTIKIPMPILRPMAIPRPAEMTMTMPMAATPMMPMAATPMMPMMMPGMMPGMAMGGQSPMGMAQMNLQGSMSAQAAAAMLAAANNLTPQQMAMLSLMSGGNAQSSAFMQLAGQLQMTPEQLTAALRALQAGTTPPPPPPPPSMSSATPPPIAQLATSAPSAPTGAPTVAALQDQLRQAEQRLKELEDLRRVQK